MWHPLHERAHEVIFNAQKEAAKRNLTHVDTEHLLLALACNIQSGGAKILGAKGVDLARVELELSRWIPGIDEKKTATDEPELTRATKRVLDLASKEAARMRRGFIGSEHILLGLMLEKKGVAAKALRNLGFEIQATRAQIEAGRFVDEAPQPENLDSESVDVFGEANRLAQASGSSIKSEHLLLALILHQPKLLAETFDLAESNFRAARVKLLADLELYEEAAKVKEEPEG